MSKASETTIALPLEDEKEVVIIGAGCAGLGCASKLYSYGFKNIVVLEAQDYLGGRIKTTFIDGDEKYPLEMGANWIHGFLGNPIYKLVLENPGLFQHKKKNLFETASIYCADESGRECDSTLVRSLWLDYLSWNAEAQTYWVNRQKSPFRNYTQFIMDKLESQMSEDSDEMRKLKIAIVKRFLKQETAEVGCSSMNLCSLNEYGSYSKPFGPDYEFPGGYSKLIEFLAAKLPPSSIKLEHAVKHISPLNSDQDPESSRILVECFNGSIFRTKHVVITCSINYLKHSYTTLFDSQLLTQKKIEAIQAVQMGTVDKIFLFYDDLASFFPDVSALHPIFIEDDDFGVIGEEHASPNSYWYHKVYTFDRFYENMLLVWITGWQAEFAESLTNEQIGKTLTRLLSRLLNNKNVPMPKKIHKTMWRSNPFVMGSYSYVDVNGSALTHINNLAEPVYIDKIPRVLFAGEATHLRYYSTVHGAYLSGQREARRLLELRNRTICGN